MTNNPQSSQELIANIQATTPSSPAILRLEFWPSGVGNAPPPIEVLISAYVVSPPPTPAPAPVTLYVIATGGLKVRPQPDTTQPQVGLLPINSPVSVYDIPGAAWVQIASGPYVGKWLSRQYLAAKLPAISANTIGAHVATA